MMTYRNKYIYISTQEEYNTWAKGKWIKENPKMFPCIYTKDVFMSQGIHEDIYCPVSIDSYVAMLKSDYNELVSAVRHLEYDGYEYLEFSRIST